MKIKIITSELKKANRNLNISLLIFGFFILLFIISFWFPKSGLMKNVYLFSLFASVSFIVISIILLLIRQSKKQTINLDKDQMAELTINSQIEPEKILKTSEIEYCGNELKTNLNSKIYEVDNKTAYELMNSGTDLKITSLTKKNNEFDTSPKELFSDLMSMLWASS